MTVTIEWHHIILMVGPLVAVKFFWDYSNSGPDRYGIGGLFTFLMSFIAVLLSSSFWLFLKYLEII